MEGYQADYEVKRRFAPVTEEMMGTAEQSWSLEAAARPNSGANAPEFFGSPGNPLTVVIQPQSLFSQNGLKRPFYGRKRKSCTLFFVVYFQPFTVNRSINPQGRPLCN
jgi:hypothetical protein